MLHFAYKRKKKKNNISHVGEVVKCSQTSNYFLELSWCSYASTTHQMFYNQVHRRVTITEKVPVNVVDNTLASFQPLWDNF